MTTHRKLEVIHDPALNRGTAFSTDERERLHLRGLVPPRQQALQYQAQRVMETYECQTTNLDKFQFLSMLMDRNTVLFYRILVDNFKQLAPIVYTPVVGEACLRFHAIYRRTRGMYFSVDDQPHFRTMVYNWPSDDVDIIVVTDGSRVLSLGDLGCNSMNIAIGKLSLYVSGAGISPSKTLPIVLDVGTDNLELRENPLYLGINRPRLSGEKYYELLDDWISAVRYRWPNALIQFEDFKSEVAEALLERYRYSRAPCFNDDIQSTGCIAIAAMLSSLRARGKSFKDIVNETIVCAGAGSAGLGVCESLIQAMEYYGISRKKALQKFCMIDERGLLGHGRKADGKRLDFVRDDMQDGMSIEEVVKEAKPTVLLGLSGVGGLFTKPIVEEMSKHTDQPVIFSMSNPSASTECTPEDAFLWSGGRAVVATGSPFPNVELEDGRIAYTNQANNAYSFPGIGLAVTVGRISSVTDEMFLAAGRRIAQLSSDEEVRKGLLFPPVTELRGVSAEVAAAVAFVAREQGLIRRELPKSVWMSQESLTKYMEKQMWEPKYGHLIAK